MNKKEIFIVIVTENASVSEHINEFNCVLHNTWYLSNNDAETAIGEARVEDRLAGESGLYDYRIINLYK